ncbi:hypothetical protein F5Y05DRAFT_228095 [Hypoxylon sp. FL0543]|nr:hypothetical protein F5Y05DRAFT_228095 [Hypoxylon sp. FL0543]
MPSTSPSCHGTVTESTPSSDMSHTMKSTTEATKAGKRKGTRSVSTLTPSQLARKRANDREAQRAIRARTKEHIENLEREIEQLRSGQDRDQTIQALLRRNKALEEELRRLKEGMGLCASDTGEQYQPPVLPSSSPPRSHCVGQSVPSYPMRNMTYSSLSDASDAWPTAVPCSVPSTVSSPTSSVGTDDFGGGNCFPTSAPSTVFVDRSSLPPHAHSPAISCISRESTLDEMKPGMFRSPDDRFHAKILTDLAEFGCPPVSVMPMTPTYHFQPWNMYHMPQYQAVPPAADALGHGTPQIL